ncbi:MAG: hypothetical protein ACRDQA_03475 [Nocardioidaceae bacterium]
MTTRGDLAQALTDTGVVRVYPTYRQSMRPGDGCIRWAGGVRDSSGLGVMDTWQAWIALPQDVAAAELWIGDHLNDLIEAIETEATFTEATPSELVLGHNSINGLIIEAVRAQESE